MYECLGDTKIGIEKTQMTEPAHAGVRSPEAFNQAVQQGAGFKIRDQL
jgi:hypothetical protein